MQSDLNYEKLLQNRSDGKALIGGKSGKPNF